MAHPNEIRGPIEEQYNAEADNLTRVYENDRVAREEQYHSEMTRIQTAKSEALVAAGLNPDGSVPRQEAPRMTRRGETVEGNPLIGTPQSELNELDDKPRRQRPSRARETGKSSERKRNTTPKKQDQDRASASEKQAAENNTN